MFDDLTPATHRFAIRNLTVAIYTNGFTGFVYRSHGCAIADAERPNFFHDASDMLAVGDTITIVARDGVRIVWVAQSDAEVVVVKGLV